MLETVSVEIPSELMRSLEKKAIARGCNLNELMVIAVAAYLIFTQQNQVNK